MNKKMILLAIFAIVMISCSKNDLMDFGNETTSLDVQNLNRSVEEAMQIALSSMSMLEDSDVTRSSSQRRIDTDKTKVCRLNGKTRSEVPTADTLMYVFNFTDDMGFAIISAPKNVEPLLAIAESGNYDPDEPTEMENFNLFMEMAKTYVESQSHTNYSRIAPMIETETTLISSKYPLITVRWGQEFPEGLYCPNTIAGCVNTAAIQIFSYYGYPTSLVLTFPQRERDSISIDWTELRKHYRGCSSYVSHTGCTATTDAHKTIGELARQCAVYAQSRFLHSGIEVPASNPLPYSYTDYSSWSNAQTSTSYYYYNFIPIFNNIENMIESMGYARPSFSAYTSKCTQPYLNSNKPLYMVGGCYEGGHAWIIDGYQYYRDVTTNYVMEPPIVTESYRFYNHINWGWNGVSNGYYLDGVFNCSNPYSLDNTSYGSSNYSFTYDLYLSPIEL